MAWSVTVEVAVMDAALGVTERPLREAGTGCPLEPGWLPPELRLLTPLQPARSRQNERIQVLCRTYFLRKFSGA